MKTKIVSLLSALVITFAVLATVSFIPRASAKDSVYTAQGSGAMPLRQSLTSIFLRE